MLTATAAEVKDDLGAGKTDLTCLWGNILHYVVQFGYGDDPRAALIADYLKHAIAEGYCRCSHNEGFACAWGVVRAVWGLAAFRDRSDIQAALEQALPFLLADHHLERADYPTPSDGKIHPLWFSLNFPLFYQVDILFTLRVLAELDALSYPGAQAALDWLAGQQDKQGRWRGRSPYRSRSWDKSAASVETSRWVSLQAADILQQARRLGFRASA